MSGRWAATYVAALFLAAAACGSLVGVALTLAAIREPDPLAGVRESVSPDGTDVVRVLPGPVEGWAAVELRSVARPRCDLRLQNRPGAADEWFWLPRCALEWSARGKWVTLSRGGEPPRVRIRRR